MEKEQLLELILVSSFELCFGFQSFQIFHFRRLSGKEQFP